MKSIINVRRSSICYWSGRLLTDVQKTRNHGYDIIVGGELFADYSECPHQTCAKPNSIRRRTLPIPLVGCLPQAAWLKDFSPASDAGGNMVGSVAHLWLIVVISVRQSTVAAISGLHCRALVMISSSIRLTAGAEIKPGGTVRVMYERSHRDYLRSGYLHHRLPVAEQQSLPW